MKSYYIGGSIVASESQKETYEDVMPSEVMSFLGTLEKDEPVEIQICSLGGDVFAGIQIYNALRSASENGHKVTTHCTSIAASIASIIFMAGDELVMDSNSFLCIHLPWSSTIGNAIDLRKEADTLDKCRDKMVAIYQRKMNLSKDEIIALLEEETWISADELETYKIDCIVNEAEQMKIAASVKTHIKDFKRTPRTLKDLIMEKKAEEIEEVEKTEDVKEEVIEETKTEAVEQVEVKEEAVEEKTEEKAEEQKPTYEELEETIKRLEERIKELEKEAEAPTDERVAGMQSTMAKKMNALRKDYDTQIMNFKDQLEKSNEGLMKAQADITNLKAMLDKSTKELSEMGNVAKLGMEGPRFSPDGRLNGAA